MAIKSRLRSLGFFFQASIVSLSMVGLTSCACSDTRKPEVDKQTDKQALLDKKNDDLAQASPVMAPAKKEVKVAVAYLKPIKQSGVHGKVMFVKVPEGVKVMADVIGLKPGKHGFHIHEHGDCSNDGAAAGDHFNPTKRQHGAPDSVERHVGDLGNLVANESGRAHYERIDQVIRLDGEETIIGRSVIVHADEDDYKTQPSGASGNKISCGVIEAAY